MTTAQYFLATLSAPTTDAKAMQDFKELFLQIGLALVIMGAAMAYLTARKKREARAAEEAASQKSNSRAPRIDKKAQARKSAQAKKSSPKAPGSERP
jgi:hypothetical protein